MLHPLMVGVERQQRVLSAWHHTTPPAATVRTTDAGLTARETAVLALLTTGLTADAIGRRLSVTAHTVRKHQQNLYRKLGTHDRLSTVLVAQELGILPPSRSPCDGNPTGPRCTPTPPSRGRSPGG